jgi:hypothetical protein
MAKFEGFLRGRGRTESTRTGNWSTGMEARVHHAHGGEQVRLVCKYGEQPPISSRAAGAPRRGVLFEVWCKANWGGEEKMLGTLVRVYDRSRTPTYRMVFVPNWDAATEVEWDNIDPEGMAA